MNQLIIVAVFGLVAVVLSCDRLEKPCDADECCRLLVLAPPILVRSFCLKSSRNNGRCAKEDYCVTDADCDSGYTCKGRTFFKWGRCKPAIPATPVLTSDPIDTTVTVGDEVIFFCTAPSYADQLKYELNNPTYTFYFSGVLLQEGSSDNLTIDADAGGAQTFLAGDYNCSVEYSNGQVSDGSNSIELVVNEPLPTTLTVNPSKSSYEEGETVEFTCTTTKSLSTFYRLYKNGNSVVTEAPGLVSPGTSSWTATVELSEVGTCVYTCKVNHSITRTDDSGPLSITVNAD